MLAASAQAATSGQPPPNQQPQHKQIQPQPPPAPQAQMRTAGQAPSPVNFARDQQHQQQPQQGGSLQGQQPGVGSPQPAHELDPAFSAQYGTAIAQAAGSQSPGVGMEQDSPEMGTTADGRRMNKRELSSSKRAAQNRAAQVSFVNSRFR